MGELALFSATLGLSPPWQVTSVTFTKGSNRLDISVEYEQAMPLLCPTCCTRGAICLAESVNEIWFHEDFFHYATYLHAKVPQLSCGCDSFPRPWCRAGSKFSRIFELVKIGTFSPLPYPMRGCK